ncbi:MAG: hypothetical protein J6J83_03800 [Oscillospiraceae bacterium]|nr:hypothetical protein [Oscillospiraceae bacterium]
MKYCVHCGAEVFDEAVVCVKCGRSIAPTQPPAVVTAKSDDTLVTIIKVFLILGCIAQGWCIIPLAWCLPITISIFHRFRDNQPVSTGLKVCSLLFVNMIAGICLLCMNESK